MEGKIATVERRDELWGVAQQEEDREFDTRASIDGQPLVPDIFSDLLKFFRENVLQVESFNDVDTANSILCNGIGAGEMLHLFARVGLHWLDNLVVENGRNRDENAGGKQQLPTQDIHIGEAKQKDHRLLDQFVYIPGEDGDLVDIIVQARDQVAGVECFRVGNGQALNMGGDTVPQIAQGVGLVAGGNDTCEIFQGNVENH